MGTSVIDAPADQFTYEAAPSVTGVSPVAGPLPAGTVVTITGTAFTGATAVSFGTAPGTITATSATQVTVTAPAGAAGTVDVTVTTPAGTSATSAADRFAYETAPTITAVSPVAGLTAGSTTVTITGTNFSAATAVAFGVSTATSYEVISATEITAVSPAEPAGPVDIAVTNRAGTSAPSSGDRFTLRTTRLSRRSAPRPGCPPAAAP